MNAIPWQWETLDRDTDRVRVIGGWIVRCSPAQTYPEDGVRPTPALVFVPDPTHEWMPDGE